MEYTVNKLAQISGVSARTLRYYDEIGLLNPVRLSSSGYRIYGKNEVDRLQQILFYKELGVSLEEIKDLLNSPGYDREKTLESHLAALMQKKKQIELLIENVSKTLKVAKGAVIMKDKEKFQGLKKKMIDENESKYGKEVRKKYGDEAVSASNAKLMNMSEAEYKKMEQLNVELNEKLKAAVQTGEPSCELAQEVCALHRESICMFWKERTYTKEAHKCLGEMYVSDERFKVYYEQIADGAAEFLRDALNIYCE